MSNPLIGDGPLTSVDRMPASLPVTHWMIDVNARYQKLVDLLISLSTGALILPPIFLQKYLGVDKEPLALFLDNWAYASTVCFGVVILLGIAFHWASAKRVKQAWQQPTYLTLTGLERILDWLFGLAALGFVGGIGCFLVFILHK